MSRRWEFDALRGLMLVLMTVTHIPTRFSGPLGQPFGYVSAAEGFVLLSGFMAGMVYTQRRLRHGEAAMREALFRRARDIYACHAGLLFFLFTLVAGIGIALNQGAVLGLVSYYIQAPTTALIGGLLLVHQPPLLDILPMYVIFLVATPAILMGGDRRGWGLVIALSAALWLGAQFGLGRFLYETFSGIIGNPIPARATGSFGFFAWQLLWVLGLCLGARYATPDTAPLKFPGWMMGAAVGIVIAGLCGRHLMGQTPFAELPALNALFDKWQLQPLRLINFVALVLVAIRFGPALAARVPRMHFLETLGKASLPVFCAHLVLALLFIALLGDNTFRSLSFDIALLVATFGLLYAVAHVSNDSGTRPVLQGPAQNAPLSA